MNCPRYCAVPVGGQLKRARGEGRRVGARLGAQSRRGGDASPINLLQHSVHSMACTARHAEAIGTIGCSPRDGPTLGQGQPTTAHDSSPCAPVQQTCCWHGAPAQAPTLNFTTRSTLLKQRRNKIKKRVAAPRSRPCSSWQPHSWAASPLGQQPPAAALVRRPAASLAAPRRRRYRRRYRRCHQLRHLLQGL